MCRPQESSSTALCLTSIFWPSPQKNLCCKPLNCFVQQAYSFRCPTHCIWRHVGIKCIETIYRAVPYDDETQAALLSLCHTGETLVSRKYDLVEDPNQRIEVKLRCSKCLMRISRPSEPCEPLGESIKVCFSHDGRLRSGRWTCCGKRIRSIGCVQSYTHTIPPKNDAALCEDWRYYTTPPVQLVEAHGRQVSKAKKGKKRHACRPFVEHLNQPRQAVVLDCEMGVSSTKWPELIRFSLIDFYSGEALIDKLVLPTNNLRSLSTP
jgi:hypothetical protein